MKIDYMWSSTLTEPEKKSIREQVEGSLEAGYLRMLKMENVCVFITSDAKDQTFEAKFTWGEGERTVRGKIKP